MVKKREAYRPFAPSVLEERLHDFFDAPQTKADLSFMTYVLRVKECFREKLGAVTHVDGSARVQTVSRATNPRYWDLIYAFGKITDVPILLNTSFNNYAEPIVDSFEDAVSCFLTTQLDCLVAGNFIIRRRTSLQESSSISKLAPSLLLHYRLEKASTRTDCSLNHEPSFALTSAKRTATKRLSIAISEAMFHMLNVADGKRSLGELISEAPGSLQTSATRCIAEAVELWGNRAIKMTPMVRVR